MKLDIAQLALLSGTPVSLGLLASWIAARRVLARRLAENDVHWEGKLAESAKAEPGGALEPEELAELQRSLDARTNENDILRARIEELENQPAPAETTHNDAELPPLREENERLSAENAEWQQRCRGLQVLQRQAEARLQALEAGEVDPGEAAAVTELENELTSLRAQLEGAASVREALEARCEELAARPAEAPSDDSAVSRELAETRARLEQSDTALARTREELAEASRVAEASARDRDRDNERDSHRVEALEQQLEATRAELNSLRSATHSDPRVAALTAQLVEREAEIEARGSKLEALDRRYADALIDLENSTREELSTLKAGLESASTDRDRHAEEADKFRAAFRSREQDLQRRKKDHESLENEMRELRTEFDRRGRERCELEAALEAAQAHGTQLGELNEKLYEFQNDLLAANATLEADKERAGSLEVEVASLREKLDKLSRERSGLRAELRSAEERSAQLNDLNEKLYSFQNELLAANAELEAKTQEIGRLVTSPGARLRAAS